MEKKTLKKGLQEITVNSQYFCKWGIPLYLYHYEFWYLKCVVVL